MTKLLYIPTGLCLEFTLANDCDSRTAIIEDCNTFTRKRSVDAMIKWLLHSTETNDNISTNFLIYNKIICPILIEELELID